MRCTLYLYLNRVYFSKKEIELSGDSPELSSEQNFTIRETELKSAIEVFRIENYRQIIKCQYDYDFVAGFTSKGNDYGRDEDFG